MLVHTREKREAWLEEQASSSAGQLVEKQWSSLWNTKVPAKVKVFLWRLAKHSLPTNDVRAKRRMAEGDQCQLCGAADSWRHALLDCTMSRCVWALIDTTITEHLICSEEGDARLWLANLIDTLKPDDQTTAFVTMWAIWYACRKAIHEQHFQSPLSTFSLVQNFVSNLCQSKDEVLKKSAQQTTTVAPRWIPPSHGMVKIS
jgi:hypothetical protein